MFALKIAPPPAEDKYTGLSEKLRVKKINNMIRYAESRLRRRYGFLKYQNAIGLTIFITSILGMIGMGAGYVAGLVPAWAAIVTNAFLASLLHELEHDLIHQQYFEDSPVMEKIMMYGVWIFRGNTPNPYYRREIHRLHHRVSGKPNDIEERMISNGMKWGIKRFFVAGDQTISFLFNRSILLKDSPQFEAGKMVRSAFPLQATWSTLWGLFLATGIADLASYFSAGHWFAWGQFAEAIAVLRIVAVVWLVPNWIRQTSIQIVSSNMHYYGDLDGERHILHQTQVLTPWWLLPLQAFCFNFGSTHGIHHFVVNQPFYVRQMVAPEAHAMMRACGVRFNDLGTFKRANRYDLNYKAA